MMQPFFAVHFLVVLMNNISMNRTYSHDNEQINRLSRKEDDEFNIFLPPQEHERAEREQKLTNLLSLCVVFTSFPRIVYASMQALWVA